VDYPVIMAGPPGTLKDRVDFLVTLKPSKDGESPGALSSELKRYFQRKIEEIASDSTAPVEIEEIQGSIPSGKSNYQ